MSQPQLDPLGQGIQAGRGRLERHQVTPDRTAFDQALDRAITMTYGLLRSPDTEASARFVELFGEIVTVAAGARVAYDDAPLTEADIHQYLIYSFNFLNSFRHA